MKKSIKELLSSTNIDDMKLGVILLMETEPNSPYLDHNSTKESKNYKDFGKGLIPWKLYDLIEELKDEKGDGEWFDPLLDYLQENDLIKNFKNE